MSFTEIYRLGTDPQCIAEIKNSWRGAMAVWQDIAKRYCEFEYFPFDEAGRNRVWNAGKYYPLQPYERIVLLSTMDNAIVWVKDAMRVAEAFQQYCQDRSYPRNWVTHPENSFGEQSTILAKLAADPTAQNDAIAWNQTSVIGDPWCCPWDNEKDDRNWYDPRTGSKHFDVYADALLEGEQHHV